LGRQRKRKNGKNGQKIIKKGDFLPKNRKKSPFLLKFKEL
jgi:hypothetical protein